MSASANFQSDAEVVAMQPQVSQLTAFARSVVIKTAAQYTAATNYLKTIKGLRTSIEEARTRITKPLLTAQREVNAQALEADTPLKKAEGEIKKAMIAFDDEQDRLRREEQVRADAEARKKQEKLQQQASKAAASGKTERAIELEHRAAAVVAPAVQPETVRVSGISRTEHWHAEATDLRALVKAIYEGRAPLSYVIANDKVLGAQARSLKQDFVCDGVRVWSDKNIAAGAA